MFSQQKEKGGRLNIADFVPDVVIGARPVRQVYLTETRKASKSEKLPRKCHYNLGKAI